MGTGSSRNDRDEYGGYYTRGGVWVGPQRPRSTTPIRTQAQANKINHAPGTPAAIVMANNPGVGWGAAARAAKDWSASGQGQGAAPAPRRASTPARPSSGGSRGYGGGGGGGGGDISAAAAAQSQIDALTAQLRSGLYSANAAPYDAMRKSVTDASAQDQAAATGAYNALDTWLQQNATNPYANVQLQRAQAAPDMNPYLASQGVGGTNYQASNPDDGGYGAFQNVLALLGANQQAGNTSRQAESQMARTFSGQQIGAADNAYLANIAAQQAAQQQALDAEKRKALLELTALTAQGGKMPDLASLGIYAPGGSAADPHGWAAIRAALDAAPK